MGVKGMNVFQCTLICKHLYKFCSLKTFSIVGPLSKLKSCTSRVPKIGKNTRELYVKNFVNQVKAVVGAYMKEYKNKWQTTA
jgi:hypothetical protein